MKAPSERHLEDWIVANPEKFGDWYPGIQIIRRQPVFANGRPDLIATQSSCLGVFAIELKKGAVTAETIIQCYRYVYDLREIHGCAVTPDQDCYRVEFEVELTGGIVVGHYIEENVLLAADAMGLSVFIYNYIPDEDAYQFTQVISESRIDDKAAFVDYASGAIGEAMRYHAELRYTHLKNIEKGGV